MANDSGTTPFFVERIPVERWKLYLLRYLLFFLVPLTVAAVFELRHETVIRDLAEGGLLAAAMSFLSVWMEGRN